MQSIVLTYSVVYREMSSNFLNVLEALVECSVVMQACTAVLWSFNQQLTRLLSFIELYHILLPLWLDTPLVPSWMSVLPCEMRPVHLLPAETNGNCWLGLGQGI